MPREIRNVGASVRARLRNLSRETGQSFELILTRYALERLLYRLGTSVHADRFVLKGAMLLTSWFTDPPQPLVIWICWDSAIQARTRWSQRSRKSLRPTVSAAQAPRPG